MLEPPSPQLVRLLSELQLCTPADLRRCRGRVRRLAHDLPAFDSVWLDALVQRGRITPFQAGVLESNRPERLRVGPCVLEQRLGGGPEGDTFQARYLTDQTACVVKLVRFHDEFVGEILERFQHLAAVTASLAHPSLVAPRRCERVGERLAIVSRLIPGPPLSELLIRRGRFPAPVVWDIARQLIDGLQVLHARGCVHGDVRAANVRLTAGGVAVLVDAGVAPALSSHLIPDPHRPPDRYDGMPPEIIGTGVSATPAGDLYSLGCLLWHLLAGRPPFPGGDPLWKLAAHQTRRVPDIRDFAPDTPEMLARSIAAMTARDPQQRPPGQVLLQHWRPARGPARRRLANFLAAFEHPNAPAGASSGVPWAWLAVLLLAISGAAVTLFDNGARNYLLSTLNTSLQSG